MCEHFSAQKFYRLGQCASEGVNILMPDHKAISITQAMLFSMTKVKV